VHLVTAKKATTKTAAKTTSKTAAKTATTKTAAKTTTKKAAKTTDKMADKSAFVAQMMKKKTEMSVSNKVSGETLASSEDGAAKPKSLSRPKKDAKSAGADSDMSNGAGSGPDPLSQKKPRKGAASLAIKKPVAVENSEGENTTDKKTWMQRRGFR